MGTLYRFDGVDLTVTDGGATLQIAHPSHLPRAFWDRVAILGGRGGPRTIYFPRETAHRVADVCRTYIAAADATDPAPPSWGPVQTIPVGQPLAAAQARLLRLVEDRQRHLDRVRELDSLIDRTRDEVVQIAGRS